MSRSVASVISATAAAKAASLCGAGFVKPDTFRTYCSAASSMACRSSISRPSLSRWMDLHMPATLATVPPRPVGMADNTVDRSTTSFSL